MKIYTIDELVELKKARTQGAKDTRPRRRRLQTASENREEHHIREGKIETGIRSGGRDWKKTKKLREILAKLSPGNPAREKLYSEEVKKSRTMGAKDVMKRKSRTGKPSIDGFVGGVEELESKSWKVNERVNDWLEGGKDAQLDALAQKHNINKKAISSHVKKEY